MNLSTDLPSGLKPMFCFFSSCKVKELVFTVFIQRWTFRMSCKVLPLQLQIHVTMRINTVWVKVYLSPVYIGLKERFLPAAKKNMSFLSCYNQKIEQCSKIVRKFVDFCGRQICCFLSLLFKLFFAVWFSSELQQSPKAY